MSQKVASHSFYFWRFQETNLSKCSNCTDLWIFHRKKILSGLKTNSFYFSVLRLLYLELFNNWFFSSLKLFKANVGRWKHMMIIKSDGSSDCIHVKTLNLTGKTGIFILQTKWFLTIITIWGITYWMITSVISRWYYKIIWLSSGNVY